MEKAGKKFPIAYLKAQILFSVSLATSSKLIIGDTLNESTESQISLCTVNMLKTEQSKVHGTNLLWKLVTVLRVKCAVCTSIISTVCTIAGTTSFGIIGTSKEQLILCEKHSCGALFLWFGEGPSMEDLSSLKVQSLEKFH